jgi:hypothetical protein
MADSRESWRGEEEEEEEELDETVSSVHVHKEQN